MPMLLDRTGPVEDRWVALPEDADLPAAGGVIVPVGRLDEALCAGGPVGLDLVNDAALDPLRDRLDRIALIRVAFPSFSDGRGFSIARRLRAMGYRGRLRAAGPVIADQFGHLLAVGFDEVEVADAVARRQPAEQWIAAAGRISRYYQPRPGDAAIATARQGAHG